MSIEKKIQKFFTNQKLNQKTIDDILEKNDQIIIALRVNKDVEKDILKKKINFFEKKLQKKLKINHVKILISFDEKAQNLFLNEEGSIFFKIKNWIASSCCRKPRNDERGESKPRNDERGESKPRNDKGGKSKPRNDEREKIDHEVEESESNNKTDALSFSQKQESSNREVKQNLNNIGEKKSTITEKNKVVGVKKIIAIASAKGGVGKSTFAVNFAVSLKKIGYKIALVDADIYGPSIPTLMNLKTKPQIENNLMLPLISHNIKCISIGSLIDQDSAGVWRGPMITKILYQLIRSVNWQADKNEVDFMVIDMPPGTGDVYLSLAQNFPIDGVVIVSTPQTLAIADVVRSIDCFKKLQIPILGLVQNMSYLENKGEKQYLFGKDGAKKLAQEKQIKFLGDIPIAQEISDANEEKIPVVLKNPSSNLAMLYGRIAEEIVDCLKNIF